MRYWEAVQVCIVAAVNFSSILQGLRKLRKLFELSIRDDQRQPNSDVHPIIMSTKSHQRTRQTDSLPPAPKPAENDIPGPLNSKGLAALPVELLDLIVSFIPDSPTPFLALSERHRVNSSALFVRKRTLAALTETCEWLRKAALPSLWRTLDVCEDVWKMEQVEEWDKAQTAKLLQQFDLVGIRNPALLSHIRYTSCLTIHFYLLIQDIAQ